MTTTKIALDSKVQWSRDPLAADVSGNVVLMSVQRGAYYGLDGVGSDIWRRLTEPTGVASLCDALAAAYDGEPDIVRADVLRFLTRLVEEGLIDVLPAQA